MSKYAILTDIQGLEDHFGDMDFKVAGTRKGITAVQMDIKIFGLPFEVVEKGLAQAKQGRLTILDIMDKTMTGPREKMSGLRAAHRLAEGADGQDPRHHRQGWGHH